MCASVCVIMCEASKPLSVCNITSPPFSASPSPSPCLFTLHCTSRPH